MNPPKGIDPKVWEVAETALYTFCNNHHLWGDLGDDKVSDLHRIIALSISQAIEAEREDILRIIDKGLYFDGSYIETSDDEVNLISQAIRNRSNTTTER